MDACLRHSAAARFPLLAFSWVLIARSVFAAETDSWPMFRGGPARTGVKAGPAPERLRLAWTYKTGGPVVSSAAIVGGVVYVGSNDGHMYALSSKDGALRWKFKTKDSVESSPTVHGGRVYFGSNDGNLYAAPNPEESTEGENSVSNSGRSRRSAGGLVIGRARAGPPRRPR